MLFLSKLSLNPDFFQIAPILLDEACMKYRFSVQVAFSVSKYDKMAESALAARAKIRPPCTLKHRVQQEYNSLLVNALNRIFKSNPSLNNFKWLLTKLELSCVRKIIPRTKKRP